MLTRPSFWLCAALTAATWGAALALLVAPVQPQQAPQMAADAREQFAFDLLAQLGNTQPSADTVAFVVEWTLAEDSGDGALSRNNPLNTTKCGYNQVSAINGDGACGVAGYATWQDGVDATVATLAQSNFAGIMAAIQANDAVGAFQALIASDWAASHYGGGADWPKVQASAAPSGALASNPIAAGGDDCGWNVRVALDANGGALQRVDIPPGATWSFNAAMGDPSFIAYRSCAGVPGGNWCNLAARYAQVARAFGAQLQFQDHGIGDLGGGPENSVAIWNVGGQAGFGNGSQDLLITNTRAVPLHFGVQEVDGGVSIIAWEG